jgi:DNA-binding response OmpR family regulator
MGAVFKILAVDDEPAIAASTHFVFGCHRFELTAARDANDALVRLSADPDFYDAVITDNNVPHASGIELVRELRRRGFCGKIMILSAHLTTGIRAAYAQMNVNVILDKPFDIHELRKTLDLLVA